MEPVNIRTELLQEIRVVANAARKELKKRELSKEEFKAIVDFVYAMAATALRLK
jgi:hypothetical protein